MQQRRAARPEWWELIARLNFELARHYGRMLVDSQLPDSRARMAATLLNNSGLRASGADARVIALKQEELGAMANLSRHPTNAILRAFEREGLVSLGYRTIRIENPAGLRAVIDED